VLMYRQGFSSYKMFFIGCGGFLLAIFSIEFSIFFIPV
jgi:hypothetical protein